ncbi:2-isopropylmalate synthase [Alkalihalobacillus alcalophilus ATCC 27647 = CGMCC 1.3604]|uniref:2-isopropylmalate synthase n=1 Tax=Alkalihalobacillus alcalophilus ATCC 27647 = CGMCC 1.3604 TaxID=1218173 RepID=A0A094YVX2_ALKAL|nr:2-isopropylmalate synthase [Alkalihalobacillus alcalophilus]KGA97672.1 2-isopropylmalate synthase [Alkalihalobacillus alcalophilus ATCC 27647 = CGMCC 1.3604]MED1561293.1 2-isopropylmalate synthase [Alkalihalobacillus alcalophilus]THG90351.1 2-isopropylmalate synthase [Alkalihalobacillus alcalophilus ATCC 27647 = CGMCC 1.3604]
MKNVSKYERGYFTPPVKSTKWMEKEYIDAPPTWCSVDLRDGNQALIIPMSLEEKLEYFQLLVDVGFKEIEVGFPAASETEYAFLRALIEQNLIPDDVTIQVLTQSRDHIIEKTFEALRGAKKAVVHLYNSTSVAQREQVFRKTEEEIIKIAVSGAKLVQKYAEKTEGNFQFQYSPESFTGTEMEFALEICNRVLDVWQPSENNKVIINLPATVSMSMPHVYASQIEYMIDHLHYSDNVIVSLHPHNDRGTGVADAELGMLAGAKRVEGTLFGNGERTGNVDIVTLALNMYSHGIDPKLNFEKLPEIKKIYERLTRMQVSQRHPYGGELVFTAFSGSHQDAIAKGMNYKEEKPESKWSVPYLLIDPKDIGREYEGDIIRINSQSGKGGIGYILKQHYGLELPLEMRESFGYAVKDVSDKNHQELQPAQIHDIFTENYVNISSPIEFLGYKFMNFDDYKTIVHVRENGVDRVLEATGNGRLDAISQALQAHLGIEYTNLIYKEHALESGSESRAVSYVGVTAKDNQVYWGCGIDPDIMTSSVKALFSSVNKIVKVIGKTEMQNS